MKDPLTNQDPIRLRTNCTCAEPGWCPRHQCEKPRGFWQLCRRSEKHFQRWEERHGPGQDFSSRLALVVSMPCRHLGELTSTRACSSCQGAVAIKIFSCAVFSTCTLAKVFTDTAACATCEAYTVTNPRPDLSAGKDEPCLKD